VLLDLLFPPVCVACGVLVAPTRAPAPTCVRCSDEREPLPPELVEVDGIAAIAPYAGPLASALGRLKYGGQPALAGPLGRLLATAPALADPSAWDLVTAVPLHRMRLLARGYDQTELIVRHAAREWPRLRRRLELRLLARTRATSPQTHLDAEARRRNVAGAFAVRRPSLARRDRIAGARVLVVDDVTTTGATLRACMEALQRAGAREVGGLALLRTLG
jgi:ComF family protein